MCKSRLMLRVVPARSRNQWLFLVRSLYLVLRNVTLFNFASPVMAFSDYAGSYKQPHVNNSSTDSYLKHLDSCALNLR